VIERTETRIDRTLLEGVRRCAAEEGRREEEIIEEAVGRYLRESVEGSRAERPWPRYPLFDSGNPTFAGRVEDELAGFGERRR
jgi:hypothetical protein